MHYYAFFLLLLGNGAMADAGLNAATLAQYRRTHLLMAV